MSALRAGVRARVSAHYGAQKLLVRAHHCISLAEIAETHRRTGGRTRNFCALWCAETPGRLPRLLYRLRKLRKLSRLPTPSMVRKNYLARHAGGAVTCGAALGGKFNADGSSGRRGGARCFR